jgi:acyl-CoA synthetase (AMP-forming)/AMP-acid ligase II
VTPRSSDDANASANRLSIPILTTAADIDSFSVSGNSAKLTFSFTEPPISPSVPPPSGDDLCLFLHTSGTTGKPKGVPLTHANLLTSMVNIAETYSLSPADRSFLVMPLFHVHGLIGALLSTLFSRGTAVIQSGKFSASHFWPELNASQCTWYTAVPTIHQILLSRAKSDFTSKGSLRFIRSCSSALSPATLAEMERVFGVPVIEAYAMSEAAHQMTSNSLPPGKRKPGSVGMGRGVLVCIKDSEGITLPQGERGEVCIRGSNVMGGYHNNPQANRANFTHDGWFRTGDQGYLDPDGYVFLTGRLKEMINRGGEKISPIVVDDVILSHPAVSLAVTFGVPDEKYGEEVHAAVVLYPDYAKQNAGDVIKQLHTHCAKHLAAFSVPKKFYIVEDVPRTSTGKIQRRIVAEHFASPQAKL